MKKYLPFLVVVLLVSAFVVQTQGEQSIAFFGLNNAGDPLFMTHLQNAGYTVNLVDPSVADAAAQLAAANANDLVIISETIGSTMVSHDVGGTLVFNLMDSPTSIISYEAFMFDEAKWTGPTIFTEFGATGVGTYPSPPLQASQDSIYNVDSSHPVAAGLSGQVVVYNTLRNVTYGLPTVAADVVATADAGGAYPTIFIYEPGDMLVDGSMAPGLRMGWFLGQQPAFDFNSLTPEGIMIVDAAVAYAIPEPATLALLALGGFGLLRKRR